ncbi:hypothetical protein MNBD_GAMMA22-2766 [hydrothermal vent metagenome]|uniref:Phosphatidic acid phosphatase type 2/haloperoxidase domain-containing protein n=1 Tax=hydrothermal vent metagenome TaxID=652676 RepID=A0A3B0ZQU8_9ZZZZ
MSKTICNNARSSYLLFLLSLFLTFPVIADSNANNKSFLDAVKSDYQKFYSSQRFIRAGFVFAAAGVVANTNLDQDIQDQYQNNIRSVGTDDFSKIAKDFGEGKYLITLSLVTALSSHYLETNNQRSAVGRWGQSTLRAYLVGGPATLLTQQLTGASRPAETSDNSKWNPFADSNGVSGHAFIGAVPFLTMARMNNDNTFVKYLLYTASTFTALSRVNDNSHYFSQAVLGWYLAYEATDSVFETNSQSKANSVAFQPFIGSDSFGLAMNIKW